MHALGHKSKGHQLIASRSEVKVIGKSSTYV